MRSENSRHIMVSFVSNPPGCVNLNIRLLRPDETFQFFYYYGPYLSATPRPGIILAVEEEKALFHRSTAQEKSCLGQHLRGVTEARVTHHDGHGSTEEDAVMKKLIMSFTVLVGLMTASAGFSGINNELPPPEKLSNNFPDLARLRIKLVEREIPQAEKELALLRSKQETADTREKVYAREIEIAKRQVEILQRQDPPIPVRLPPSKKN
jgi:hypothetical protein